MRADGQGHSARGSFQKLGERHRTYLVVNAFLAGMNVLTGGPWWFLWLLATGIAWAIWRGEFPKTVWIAVLLLQAVLVVGAVLALQTGEQDEERIEQRVSKATIETHEERAQAFTWAAGGVLAIAGLATIVRSARTRGWLMATTAAGSAAVLALGLAVGHAGGTMVHGEGGLTAMSSSSASASQPAGQEQQRHDDDD